MAHLLRPTPGCGSWRMPWTVARLDLAVWILVAQFWVCPTVIWDRLTGGDWGPGPTNFFLRNLETPFYGHTIWRTWGFKLSYHGMECGSKFWKPKWVLKKITLQWSQGSNNKRNMWKNHAFALCGTPTARRKDNSSWVGLRTYCSGDYWYHLRSFEAHSLFGWLVAKFSSFFINHPR